MLECIITSSILIGVVIALRFLFRGKISPRLQYALWGLVLLRLMMPFPMPGSPVSIMNTVQQTYFGETLTAHGTPASPLPAATASEKPPDSSAVSDANTNSSGYEISSGSIPASGPYYQGTSISKILGIIWLAGSISIGLWFACTNIIFYIRLYKTRKLYPEAGDRLPVYITGQISSPCLFGILRPAVYLTPKAIESKSGISHIIAHELCHYRQGDHIWPILRGICIAVWWWNPLVWAAAIFSQEDSELACDEAVIKLIGEENRLAYGRTLIDMIAVTKPSSALMLAATTMASENHGIKRRLCMIIKAPKTFIPALTAVLLIAAISVGCTFTGASKHNGQQDLPPGSTGSDGEGASAAYSFVRLSNGKELSTVAPLSGDSSKLAEAVIMDYMVKSAAWPGTEINSLDECYLLRTTYSDGTSSDYYAYLSDGNAVMQMGKDGYYSRIDNALYEKLASLPYSMPDFTDFGEPRAAAADRTDLEACIRDAILRSKGSAISKASGNGFAELKSGFCAVESHITLKTVEDGSMTTVYAMAMYNEYSYEGGRISDTAGSHMPIAITFNKNAAGEYELLEYWIPKDGAYYLPSIKEKFPQDIYQKAIDTQFYVLAQIQSCYAQVIEHGKIDTHAYISNLVEAIASSPADASSPYAYIDAHPIEYRELLYYGDYTLKYAYTEFLKGRQTGLHGHIMLSAMRRLLGSEDMELAVASTAQEWFDAWKDNAVLMRNKSSMELMKSNNPKAYMLLEMLD